MKVLQLGKFYPIKGGVEKVMYDLTVGFAERPELRVECDMMCAACQGGSRTLSPGGGASLSCLRTLCKASGTMVAPAMIPALRKVCGRYDIIHVHHPDPMAALALYLSGYKGKVVLHWHSDIQKRKLLQGMYRPLQEWLLRRADIVVGTSPVYLAESPFLKDVQHKTVCLPIGVEPVCPDPGAVERVRNRFQGKKIVFSLGRLVPYKGYRYLVEAARYLDDSYVILIGGTGPLADKLPAHIDACGVADRVKLLGRIADGELPAYYGACRLFCLSSIYKTEAFGIVQIEAMSCGKPVVATRIPQSGVAWVNAHGVSGLNVEPRNARQLAEAIRAIADDEATCETYSRRAAQRYRELFTKDKMISKCAGIYQDPRTTERNLPPPIMNCDTVSKAYILAKRGFDILGSLVGIVVMSLPFAIIWLAVRLEDGGHAIFQQERVGYKGCLFTLYKFRSMAVSAEADGKPALYRKGDKRLTRVGRFLREHHLDELPQLWNVLKGEMSFVGPRPEREFFVNQIKRENPDYELLYAIRPGLFSAATLYNGYTDNMEKMLERLRMDLEYLRTRSLWTDTKIIFLTVASILCGKKF